MTAHGCGVGATHGQGLYLGRGGESSVLTHGRVADTGFRRMAAAPKMRSHVLVEPGKLELREVPKPAAGPGELVVRVRTALTCGTDVKAFLRGHPKWPMPTPFGHEFCGEVAEAG